METLIIPYILSVYSPFSDRVGLPLHNIHNPSPFTSIILPSINKYILPAPDQHGFRPVHSTTSALLQLTTDIAMGYNQRNPSDRTVCVAIDYYLFM